MMVARRAPGPAYANLQWRNRGRCGEAARQTLRGFGGFECEYNFCDMARTLQMGENAFRRSFQKVRRCKKDTYYNFCVMCLMAAFVPHRSFHVIASNGIVPNPPYIMTASPVPSVRVLETVRDADVVALFGALLTLSVRDRAIIVLNDHRFWDMLLALHRQATRSHRPSMAMPLGPRRPTARAV
jgi:hypothetical protein